MTQHIRVNLGAALFDEYSRHADLEGPLSVENAFLVACQKPDGPELTAMLQCAGTSTPSIAKRHEISVTFEHGLDQFKRWCKEFELEVNSAIRGVIQYVVMNPGFINEIHSFEEQTLLRLEAAKLDGALEESLLRGWPDEDHVRVRQSTRSIQARLTQCCGVPEFDDGIGNLFCPECGQSISLTSPQGHTCQNCGLQEFDSHWRCEECGCYSGPPTWESFLNPYR